MAASTKLIPKKRGRPKIGEGVQIQVRLRPDLLAGLDKFAAEEGLNRPEAIRAALREYLITYGISPTAI